MANSTRIQKKLELARQELLDMGLRNPLLNYRTLKAKGIEVVNELPHEVFRILVDSKKKMTFLDSSKQEEYENTNDSGDQDHNYDQSPKEKYIDSKLQTKYTEKQLQSRLLNTYLAARTYIEEQGVNILYLALGMLNWYESDSSQELRRAPLILVPVQLDRTSATERFTISYTEEDVGYNISLLAKLKSEFGIELPILEDEFDINNYFKAVSEAIKGHKRWFVDNQSIVIGFFSFGKFLMYRDLDVANWPEQERLTEHPIITALLEEGFNEASSNIAEDDHLDAFMKISDSNHIKDADSSQNIAILDVAQGRNMVIQGPPGTGKSQTITNIIADAIGRGKTVLFVSEKMAALEVVKRRLDEVGLGVACLELHSHKTNKKALLDELSSTLQLGKPQNDAAFQMNILEDLRKRLNQYSEALNTPMPVSEVTPYRALGHLTNYAIKFKGIDVPKIELDSMANWTTEDFAKKEMLIEQIQNKIQSMGLPCKHVFWGCSRKLLLPTDLDNIKKAIESVILSTEQMIFKIESSNREVAFPKPDNCNDIEMICATFATLLDSPDLQGVTVDSTQWLEEKDTLLRLTNDGIQCQSIKTRLEEFLIPEAWDYDLIETRLQIVTYNSKWWRFLSGDFRKAKNRILGLCKLKSGQKIDYLEVIDGILEVKRFREFIKEAEPTATILFPSYWNGIRTEWEKLSKLLKWAVQIHEDIKEDRLPSWIMNVSQTTFDKTFLKKVINEFYAGLKEVQEGTKHLCELLEFSSAVRFVKDEPLESLNYSHLKELLVSWKENLRDLQDLTSYNLLSETCQNEGLSSFTQLSVNWEFAPQYLTDCLRYNWYQLIAKQAFQARQPIAQFDGTQHKQTVDKFCELDRKLFNANRLKLAEAHWTTLPKHEAGGQLGILRREFEKKKGHMPIRQLMLKAGNAIQAIKPVYMMGPLSVASYLQPGTIDFDLVLFDEASQVKPVDAFGAIIRGKQVVVVGDSKQMPPTNFFDSLAKDDDENDEENFVADIESILGLFVGQNAPQRMLRWHYRSKHESLITVSNYEFYDNKLVVFPSPDAERRESGLVFHYLPQTSYDRGRTRTNKEEAKEVAKAVLDHARVHPNLTLGVAAFSMAQMQAIVDEVELLRKTNRDCESFFAAHSHEPFFVKNLENVQGDERDVIFISVGYGKTAEGYLAMEFGPLNRDGGERRLNVLITRARLRCEVFTNLKADDLDLDRTNSRGVKSFKTFLKYAETGILDVPKETGKDFDSPFEEAVCIALQNLGYEVEKQVGSGGFLIDLAIKDIEQPGRYLLGIECDGATYHSARSARDRDRLRQEVLESLGWRFHRIWSTDWFRHSERELKRVVEAIEKAKHYRSQPKKQQDKQHEPVLSIQRRIQEEKPNSSEVINYSSAKLSIGLGDNEIPSLPLSLRCSWVYQVVSVESPIHKSEMMKRICDAAGIKRVGTRIQTSLEEAASALVKEGRIKKKGEFLWLEDMVTPKIRDRSEYEGAKKLELISPEELGEAVLKVVRDSFGIDQESAIQAVCQLVGFSRTTDEMKRNIRSLLNQLISNKTLILKGQHLELNK